MAAVAVLSVAGCEHRIDRGMVVGKDHFPGVTTWVECGADCLTRHDRLPAWSLELRDGARSGYRPVTEAEYGRYDIGSVYP
ncbi:hypothetical protein [[Mycobacterium] nativiensis]|nr:hypothetical protein [Mycolicibacter sp. MYC340]MEB3033533.1 hypothetical protein [Mycolicibacter sp. MYC340]